jgi:O-antigen/teichoic acid export membrane protein
MSIFSRLKETAKHSLVFGVGGLLNQAINFFLLPIYLAYMPVEDYGVLNLLLTAGVLAAMIPKATVSQSLFRSFYDYETEEDRAMVINTALFLSCILAGVILLIGVIFSRPLSVLLTGNSKYAFLTVVVLLNSMTTSMNTVVMAIFRARKWSKRYVLLSVASAPVSLGVTAYLVIVQGLNVAGPVYGTLISTVITTLLSLWMIRQDLRWMVSWAEIRKMVSFGAPYIPASFMSFMQKSGDRLVIQAILGPAAVGIYALATRMAHIVSVLVISPYSLIEPAIIMSAKHDPRAKDFYARLLTYYLLLTSYVGLGLSLLVGDVLQLFASNNPAYLQAVPIVPWVSLAGILFGTRGLVYVGSYLKGHTHWVPISLGIGAVLYYGFMFVLLPEFGVLGAGVALVIGYVGMLLLRYGVSQRIYAVPWEFSRILKLALVTIVLFIFGQSIDTLVASKITSFLAKFVLVALGFPSLLILIHFYDSLERAKIESYLRLAKTKLLLKFS